MKLFAKLLSAAGVLAGLAYLACRTVGSRLHTARKED